MISSAGPTPAQERPPLGGRFLTVWAGQSLSALGSMLGNIGIGVWVFLETGSAIWLGVLVALASAPTVLVAPFVRLVDRFPRRSVMIWGDVVASIGTVIALVLAAAGRLEVWHLAVAGFVGGIGTAFQHPAFQAAIPSLVEPPALARANGLNQFGPALAVVLGPALGTPIVAWWGIEAVLIVDVATFVVAIATTTAVRFGDVAGHEADTADDGSWQAAFTFLRGAGRPLAVLIGTMAATNLMLSGFNISLITTAIEVGGASKSGLVLASGGVAMLAGSLLLGARGLPRRRISTLSGAIAAVGVGCWIAAVRPVFALMIVGTVVGLAAVPAVNAAVSTIFHERVPAGMQGRVFGLRFAVGSSLGPVGSLATGFVIARVATPAMDGGVGADTIGRVIGTGPGRGGALVLIVVGAALVVLAAAVAASSVRRELDLAAPVPDAHGAVAPMVGATAPSA